MCFDFHMNIFKTDNAHTLMIAEEHMLKTLREWMTRFQLADSQWLFRAFWHSSMSSTHECDSITSASSTYSVKFTLGYCNADSKGDRMHLFVH